MRWIPDPTGRFKERPFYEGAEIDYECEDMIGECLEKRGKFPFVPPLDTDTLNVLLESYASDLDLYADLVKLEGPGVEGVTEFRKGKVPKTLIDKTLSEKQTSSNRLRSTLAHELFHARFHRVLWELHWSGLGGDVRCHQGQIISLNKTDWYEWQAAYGSGAILMPLTAINKMFGAPAQIPENTLEGRTMTEAVATTFQVSMEAARVRLVQLNFLLGQQRPANFA